MEKLFFVLGYLAMAAFVSFLLSWPAYMLWNGCLVDAISGVHEVTWLQMWGITMLANVLFKPSLKTGKD